MQFSVFAIAAVLTGVVSAQSDQPPKCATDNCIAQLLPASCNLDPKCICGDKNFITQISCCVFTNCSQGDQAAALAYAQLFCQPAGVSLPSSAGCSSGASSTAPATASSTATSSAVPVTTASAPIVTTPAASNSVSSVSSVVSSVNSVVSSATSSAAAAATTSNAANEKFAAQGMGLFGAIVGAVALL